MSIKNRLEQLKQKKKEITESVATATSTLSQDFLLEANRIVNTVKTKLNDIPEWFSLENGIQIDIVKKFVTEEIKDDQFLGINLDGLISKILSQVNGYGILDNIVNDKEIDKIFVNSTNYIAVQKNKDISKIPLKFDTETELMSTIKRILSLSGLNFDEKRTFYEGKLPDNLIFNIIMPPVAQSGITLTIEKLQDKILDFEHLIQADFMSFEAAKFLESAMNDSKNILIAGAFDVGKQVLLNAMTLKLPLNQRIFCISDYRSILLNQQNLIAFDSTNLQNNKEQLNKLFENVISQRPDGLIVPSLNGNMAFEVLKTANIGLKGIITTVLANSQEDAIDRFLGKIFALDTGINMNILRKRFANSFDYIVFISESNIAKTVKISEIVVDKDSNIKLKNLLVEKTLQKKAQPIKKSVQKKE